MDKVGEIKQELNNRKGIEEVIIKENRIQFW